MQRHETDLWSLVGGLFATGGAVLHLGGARLDARWAGVLVLVVTGVAAIVSAVRPRPENRG